MADSRKNFPFCVALTGGVASGKTTVAALFAVLGADVIDADIAARELVVAPSPALAQIVKVFGSEVLDRAGALDRRAMRERIFANPAEREKLEAILHPRLRDVLRERAAMSGAPYVMLVIPLLAENRAAYDWVDRVLVVDASRAMQRTRLLLRDHLTAQLADAMLDAQASREARLAMADDVIDNAAPRVALDDRVAALHAYYLELARAQRGG